MRLDELFTLDEALEKTQRLSGTIQPWGNYVEAVVNPTPSMILRMLATQNTNSTKLINYHRAVIRVVSYSGGDNIIAGDGHEYTHHDLHYVAADQAHPAVLEDEDVYGSWILSDEAKPGKHTYLLGGRNIKVVYFVDAQGYATGKPTYPLPARWPAGLRRALAV